MRVALLVTALPNLNLWAALTPELSRTDLRRRQSHNLNGTLSTPRSGVGLDELLDIARFSCTTAARKARRRYYRPFSCLDSS